MAGLHDCATEMIWMYFAGLVSGVLLFFSIFILLWRFQTKRMKKLAGFLHLRDRHNKEPSDTEKRRTYSLRAPPAPPESPVVLRRKQASEPTMTFNNHVTLQSMYSSPYDVTRLHQSNNHVMLQSMYSDPRDFVRRDTRSSSKTPSEDPYSEVVIKPRPSVHSGELAHESPSFTEEPLYSTVRHSQHKNCKKRTNPDRGTHAPQSARSSNRRSNESNRLSGNREVLGEHRLSAFQSYRRSTCPELDVHQFQRFSRSQSQDDRLSQRPKTITDQEREYKHHSDGFEEPLYYTLENVNPCPIRPLSNHVVSRDSQYSTQSSLSRVSFPGRISLGLSETIMSEYPFLRQESCHIFQDELKREATSGSAISTSV
ncbi:uncharacterized protein LOC111108677 [Crassostrea virginica]